MLSQFEEVWCNVKMCGNQYDEYDITFNASQGLHINKCNWNEWLQSNVKKKKEGCQLGNIEQLKL